MCLGWLIFCPDRVQIPELWGNSDFISPFLYLDISLQKTKKGAVKKVSKKEEGSFERVILLLFEVNK